MGPRAPAGYTSQQLIFDHQPSGVPRGEETRYNDYPCALLRANTSIADEVTNVRTLQVSVDNGLALTEIPTPTSTPAPVSVAQRFGHDRREVLESLRAV